MSLTFPSSPTVGDTYTAADNIWYWDGTKWRTYGNQGAIGPAGATGSAGNDLPKITAVTYTDSGYTSNGASSIAPSTAGYIYLTGSNFQSGCSVYVNGSAMTTTYVSSTRVNVAITGQSAASYHIYFYNPDGGTTINVNGLTIITPITLSGGTVTYDGNYTVRTFNTTGSLVVSGGTLLTDVLVVAGGGAGGYNTSNSGGGGAGGLIYHQGASIASGTYVVTIGGGGSPGQSYANKSVGNGTNTTVGALYTAVGGGVGAGLFSPYSDAANAGGSGGGAAYSGGSTGGATTQSSQSGNSGTYGFGYAGGNASADNSAGGGGAGAVGGTGFSAGNNLRNLSGAGGAGKSIGIVLVASPSYYAGGGGGGTANNSVGGAGGVGGGGAGWASGGVVGVDGTVNKGGGGGASSTGSTGAGGSGVVIIRYLT